MWRVVDVLLALGDEQRQLQVAGDVDALRPDQARDVADAVVRVLPVQAREKSLQLRVSDDDVQAQAFGVLTLTSKWATIRH